MKKQRLDESEILKIFSSVVRLKIVAALMSAPGLSFSELMEQLLLTRGNLSSHMTALEKHQFIAITKCFRNKKAHTSYTLTLRGSEAFEQYVAHLESIILPTRELSSTTSEGVDNAQ